MTASELREAPSPEPPSLGPIVGESPAIRRAVDLARRFAPTQVPILLVGPTGSGKELIAQHVHRWSGRRELIDVNCAAIPRDLVEGWLFGHRRGAFSSALESARGLIEAADGGTLFYDEVGSFALEIQAKLLRVLETGEVRRLGETAKRRVDVRIIAAAQCSLRDAIAGGTFRLDLYQRIAGVVINLPPLAERGDDVTLLAQHFAAARGRLLTPEAKRLLCTHAWPGNVRELAAALDRAVRLCEDRALCADVVGEAIALGFPRDAVLDGGGNGDEAGDAGLRRRLLDACQRHDWDAGRAAAALAISRATLYRRLEQFGISLRAHRKNSQFVLRQIENS